MNYDSTGVVIATGGGGMLAATGAPEVLWWGLAAFALVCVGTAIKRIVPKREGR